MRIIAISRVQLARKKLVLKSLDAKKWNSAERKNIPEDFVPVFAVVRRDLFRKGIASKNHHIFITFLWFSLQSLWNFIANFTILIMYLPLQIKINKVSKRTFTSVRLFDLESELESGIIQTLAPITLYHQFSKLNYSQIIFISHNNRQPILIIIIGKNVYPVWVLDAWFFADRQSFWSIGPLPWWHLHIFFFLSFIFEKSRSHLIEVLTYSLKYQPLYRRI